MMVRSVFHILAVNDFSSILVIIRGKAYHDQLSHFLPIYKFTKVYPEIVFTVILKVNNEIFSQYKCYWINAHVLKVQFFSLQNFVILITLFKSYLKYADNFHDGVSHKCGMSVLSEKWKETELYYKYIANKI